ncbi:metallophosphoesterase family protein [Flavobacteriales bacterium]|jgi:putative phosphoesterase|nr:metallophosphoesterase family protein [Flavobacteriales bacterium]MDC3390500.1 metallophosphatase family protein [Flavobacteriales bacterium]|tara:strand:- start:453 stop:953 length:501 start_codon:yes stop_codon:yes gene_type:complete
MKKIILLSDTHNSLDKRFTKHFQNADEIWHAGDIGDIKIIDQLRLYAKVRAVWGNIDNHIIRSEFKENLYFKCEGMKVMMSHIGGYPGRYSKKIFPIIEQANPDIFISGHSHILKVIYDKKNNLLHMNPGAIGDYGIHKVKTILSFIIEDEKVKNLNIIEFPRTRN